MGKKPPSKDATVFSLDGKAAIGTYSLDSNVGCFNGDLFDGASSSSLLSQLSSLQKVSYSSSCLSRLNA